jgi:adenylate cyclase
MPITIDERTLLVAFADLARYAKISESSSNSEMFTVITEFSELVGSVVENAGGKVIKFIGDAALITFEESQALDGVAALRSLKTTVDCWLESRGLESELLIRAHIGRVAVGKIGPGNDKRLDIIGRVVNETAMLNRGPFVMSPQLKKFLAS